MEEIVGILLAVWNLIVHMKLIKNCLIRTMFPYQAIKIVNTNFISNLTFFIFFNHGIIALCVSYKKLMEIIIILQS